MLSSHLDPYKYVSVSVLGTHTPCRKAISLLAGNLIQYAGHSLQEKEIDKYQIFTQINGDQRGLTINFGREYANYAMQLQQALTNIGFQFCHVNAEGLFSIGSELPTDTYPVHNEIGRFILYVCQTWKIDGHSYLRDLYCDKSGKEAGIKGLSPAEQAALQGIFQQCHWMHSAVKLKDNMISKAKGMLLFRSIYDGTNSFSNYLFFNLLVHGMRLQLPACHLRPINSASEAENKSTINSSKFSFIDQGDIFAEIASLNEIEKVVVFSADNPYRPGGAVTLGSKGTVEEIICRSSNYFFKLMQHLNYEDPFYLAIRGIFLHAIPTEKTITIRPGAGISSNLYGNSIPEYLSEQYISKLIEHMDKMLHMSKKLLEEKTYYTHRQRENFVSKETEVTFMQDNGKMVQADVISMDGIDGREKGVLINKFGFPEEYNEREKYFKDGKFDEQSVVDVYQQRWHKAFQLMLASNPNKVILVAVGAGAFDPTEERFFTKASAKGFALALKQAHESTTILEKIYSMPNLKIVFPFREAEGKNIVFKIFKEEILKVFPDAPSDCFEFHDRPRRPEMKIG
ncbi:MAG TPA: hypothetical protein VHZ76_09665 [Gammaproteobacteria bacterium]|jgi:hypothetical protein|nr:hypothetical protein [Gammaproteobacteria bacterium]